MINKLSLSAFSMKNLATKGREQIICEQKNQWTKTKSMNHKLNADFLMFLLQKTHNPTCKWNFFLFGFLNVMNAENKLGALDQ